MLSRFQHFTDSAFAAILSPNSASAYACRHGFVPVGGVAGVVGGVLWLIYIIWFSQQPIGPDGLRESYETANLFRVAIYVPFGAALVAMHMVQRNHHTKREPLALRVVVGGIAAVGISRVLVDLNVLPAPVFGLSVAIYTLGFPWYLIETLRTGVLPRVPVAALLFSAFVLFFADTGTQAIWRTSLFAFAWMWVGYVLVTLRPRAIAASENRGAESPQ